MKNALQWYIHSVSELYIYIYITSRPSCERHEIPRYALAGFGKPTSRTKLSLGHLALCLLSFPARVVLAHVCGVRDDGVPLGDEEATQLEVPQRFLDSDDCDAPHPIAGLW